MAKRAKEMLVATDFENAPTKERILQAAGVVDDFKTDTGRKTKRLGALLDYMSNKGQINANQYAAGQKAHAEWYAAGFAPIGAVDLSRVRVDGGGVFDATSYRMDNAKKFSDAMVAIGLMGARAFRAMVLHEMSACEYGQTHYGYKDRAAATSAAYAVLRDSLSGLDIHYTGGARSNMGKTVSHMAPGMRPTNRPEEREG
jgi:hypothetical protein